jgi:hypothetical protein
MAFRLNDEFVPAPGDGDAEIRKLVQQLESGDSVARKAAWKS